jgi:hypothetical protein
VDVVSLLDALVAAGLSDAIQDEMTAAVGNASGVPLGSVRGLLIGVGVGAAAALRIVRQLVSVWMPVRLGLLPCVLAMVMSMSPRFLAAERP